MLPDNATRPWGTTGAVATDVQPPLSTPALPVPAGDNRVDNLFQHADRLRELLRTAERPSEAELGPHHQPAAPQPYASPPLTAALLTEHQLLRTADRPSEAELEPHHQPAAPQPYTSPHLTAYLTEHQLNYGVHESRKGDQFDSHQHPPCNPSPIPNSTNTNAHAHAQNGALSRPHSNSERQPPVARRPPPRIRPTPPTRYDPTPNSASAADRAEATAAQFLHSLFPSRPQPPNPNRPLLPRPSPPEPPLLSQSSGSRCRGSGSANALAPNSKSRPHSTAADPKRPTSKPKLLEEVLQAVPSGRSNAGTFTPQHWHWA